MTSDEIRHAFTTVTPKQFACGFICGIVLGTIIVVTVVATLWHP